MRCRTNRPDPYDDAYDHYRSTGDRTRLQMHKPGTDNVKLFGLSGASYPAQQTKEELRLKTAGSGFTQRKFRMEVITIGIHDEFRLAD